MTVYSPYIARLIKAGKLADGHHEVCHNCGGKGIVSAYVPYPEHGPDIPIYKRQAHYKTNPPVWEDCWVCSKDRAISKLLDACGLVEFPTFEQFSVTGRLESKKQAKQAAVKFSQTPSGFLTLYGSYGTGKSMLAKCIVYQAIQDGCPAYYTTAPEMVGQIRARFSESPADVDQAIRHYAEKGLLVIDELDKVNQTSWVEETIQRIIDKRYNDQSATVLVMNVEPGKMPGYLASRINGGVVVQVPEPDMRQVLKMKKEHENGNQF